jgi:hypothetical protein
MDELEQQRSLKRISELEARVAVIEAMLMPKDERSMQERLTGVSSAPKKVEEPVVHEFSRQEQYTGIPLKRTWWRYDPQAPTVWGAVMPADDWSVVRVDIFTNSNPVPVSLLYPVNGIDTSGQLPIQALLSVQAGLVTTFSNGQQWIRDVPGYGGALLRLR